MRINPSPELATVGGKAYQLYRLAACCCVPPFFTIAFDDDAELEQPEALETVLRECKRRGFELMAVRSSASVEDSTHASFAGMFASVLNVTPAGLFGAIRTVLDSSRSERVRAYCEAQGLDRSEIRMAVIIQRMIASRVAGVCFTRLSEESGSLVIEACLGVGEALVSGRVSPDRYVVNRESLSIEHESVGYQTVILRATRDSSDVGARYEALPFYKRNARKLSSDEIRRIAAASLAIEKELGFAAADVEWAIEGESLYVLQARPYTGVSARAVERGSNRG